MMAGLVGLMPAIRPRRRGKAAANLSLLLCVFALGFGIDAWRKPAMALFVAPGDSVEVAFFFESPPNVGGAAIDFLALTTTPFSASGPGIAIHAQLFDGTTLLGSGMRPNAALISFTDGAFSNAIPASLGSVTDPGFQGRIRFTPDFPGGAGFIDFDPDNFNARAGHGNPTGVLLQQDGATIASVSVSADVAIPTTETPAPAALFLFFSGLVVLGFVLIWRRQKDETGSA
jgi:hypothetical protein